MFGAATEVEQTFLRRLLGGELRQGALLGVMTDAIAKASGQPLAEVRRAAMLRGDLPAVAACRADRGVARPVPARGRPTGRADARPDGDVGRRTPSSASTAPPRSRPSSTAPGCRSTATADDVSIYTRSLDDVTDRLPEVVAAVRALPVQSLVADGEAIALRPDGRPHPFQVTASRFGSRTVDPDRLPLSAFLFDVLHVDGADLLDLPTADRLAVLDRIVPAEQRVDRLVTADPDEAQEFLDRTLEAGHEGVMAKSLDAPYEAGPPRRRLAQGQAGAHPRPRRARRRVGLGTPPRQAVEHPPRRA